MKKAAKLSRSWNTIAAAGVLLAACAACCLSLPAVAALLAWIGTTGLVAGLSNWIFAAAAAIVGVVLVQWRRGRKGKCQMPNGLHAGCSSTARATQASADAKLPSAPASKCCIK